MGEEEKKKSIFDPSLLPWVTNIKLKRLNGKYSGGHPYSTAIVWVLRARRTPEVLPHVILKLWKRAGQSILCTNVREIYH